ESSAYSSCSLRAVSSKGCKFPETIHPAAPPHKTCRQDLRSVLRSQLLMVCVRDVQLSLLGRREERARTGPSRISNRFLTLPLQIPRRRGTRRGRGEQQT